MGLNVAQFLRLRRALAAREEGRKAAYPAIWRPAPGEMLEGVVVEIGTARTRYAAARRYLRVRAADGGEVIHIWVTSGLQNEFAEQGEPQVGETIALKFVGPEKTRAGRPYHRFLLVRSGADDQTKEEKNEK